MSDLMRKILNRYVLSLYGISFIIILFGMVLFRESHKTAYDLSLVVGTGLFITTLVSSFFNYYLNLDINKYFSIISGSEKAGIKKVYANRDDVIKTIEKEIEKSRGNIDILAIAGTDFFQAKCEVLKELERMCTNNSNTNARVLLLDPRSYNAVRRALIEEGQEFNDMHETELCRNCLSSLEQLEKIFLHQNKIKESKDIKEYKFFLTTRTYTTSPAFLYAKINDKIFLEQYHYGISNDEKKSSLRKCIGKKVPVLEFRRHSLSSQLYESHFEYIWERSKGREINKDFIKKVRDDITSNEFIDTDSRVGRTKEFIDNTLRAKQTKSIDEERLENGVTSRIANSC